MMQNCFEIQLERPVRSFSESVGRPDSQVRTKKYEYLKLSRHHVSATSALLK